MIFHIPYMIYLSKNIQKYPKISKIIQNYPKWIFWINEPKILKSKNVKFGKYFLEFEISFVYTFKNIYIYIYIYTFVYTSFN